MVVCWTKFLRYAFYLKTGDFKLIRCSICRDYLVTKNTLCVKFENVFSHENFKLHTMASLLSDDILLCHIIIEQFTSVEQHIGGLLAAVPPLVNACEEFLTISHDINNK